MKDIPFPPDFALEPLQGTRTTPARSGTPRLLHCGADVRVHRGDRRLCGRVSEGVLSALRFCRTPRSADAIVSECETTSIDDEREISISVRFDVRFSSQGSALGCPVFRLRLPSSAGFCLRFGVHDESKSQTGRQSLKRRHPRAEPCDEGFF